MWKLATLFGLVAGCAPGGAVETDVMPADGCPNGLLRAANASFVAPRFRIDGTEYPAAFDPEFEFGGIAAACVHPTGTELQIIFMLGSNPFGSLNVSATEDVNAALSESTGLIDLDLFGAPAPLRIRDGADWQSGTFAITHPDGGLAVDLQGLAVPDGHSVDLRISAAAQPD